MNSDFSYCLKCLFLEIGLHCYKFPLVLLLLCPKDFSMLYFHLFLCLFLLLLLFILWSNSCSVACCLIFTYLWFFSVFLLSMISRFIPWYLEKILDMTSIFSNLLRLALCPNIWSVLETMQLRRMCLLLYLDESSLNIY